MLKYDLWKEEREKATEEGGLKVLRHETVAGKPAAMVWLPKAKKPFINYYYFKKENREEAIKNAKENFAAHLRLKEQYKQERAGSPEMLEQVKPGTIFHYSWGYDQTNCEFFEVIERKNKTVKIRKIGSERAENKPIGQMSEHRIPVKGAFIEREPILTKRIQFYGKTPTITMSSYGCCNLWSGQPKYCSWYA